ncbi:formyl transferase family protein [Burkholderia pseudomallei MSHR332]|nr:formyl transferase family protein [Burkholderia pseudomallei MSHR332]
MKPRAVVFAYHNVGVRCLQVLLARGVDVALVVTHEDSPTEHIWFGSVAALAAEHGIAVITPADPAGADVRAALASAKPDFIFSFYYRHMLPVDLLALAARGAYNMHGSLLPKYRGRVPTNWAVLNGETETGATLHEMAAKPDAGAIVGQTAVPILPDDTAAQVFDKVTVAAEQTLWRVLPALLAGEAPHLPNDLSQGSYYGGRKRGRAHRLDAAGRERVQPDPRGRAAVSGRVHRSRRHALRDRARAARRARHGRRARGRRFAAGPARKR